MKITLTFENGNTENLNLDSSYSVKMAKALFMGKWRSENGVVIKVRKFKTN